MTLRGCNPAADSQSKKISRWHCHASPLRSPQKPHSLWQKALSQPQLNARYFPKRLPRPLWGICKEDLEKEMKTNSKISGHIIRSTASAVFLSLAFIALSSAFNSPNKWDKSAMAAGTYDRMAK